MSTNKASIPFPSIPVIPPSPVDPADAEVKHYLTHNPYSNIGQFGFWIKNRHLLSDLEDDILNQNKDEILNILGGLRFVMNLVLKQQFNLQYVEHQALFTFLHQLHEEKETPSIESVQSLSLISLNQLCISKIFNFLQEAEREKLQQCCSELAIIGAMKASTLHRESNRMNILYRDNKSDILADFQLIAASDNLLVKRKGLQNMTNNLFRSRSQNKRYATLLCNSGYLAFVIDTLRLKPSDVDNKEEHRKLIASALCTIEHLTHSMRRFYLYVVSLNNFWKILNEHISILSAISIDSDIFKRILQISIHLLSHNESFKNCIDISQMTRFVLRNVLNFPWDTKSLSMQLLNLLLDDKNVNDIKSFDINKLFDLLKLYAKQTDYNQWQQFLSVGDELFYRWWGEKGGISCQDGTKTVTSINRAKHNSYLDLKGHYSHSDVIKETCSHTQYNARLFPIIYTFGCPKDTVLWIARLLKLVCVRNQSKLNNEHHKYALMCICNQVYFWRRYKRIQKQMRKQPEDDEETKHMLRRMGVFEQEEDDDDEYENDHYQSMVSHFIAASPNIVLHDTFLSFMSRYLRDREDDTNIFYFKKMLSILHERNLNVLKQFVVSKYMVPFFETELFFDANDTDVLIELTKVFATHSQNKYIIKIMKCLADNVNISKGDASSAFIRMRGRECTINNENSIRVLIRHKHSDVIRIILDELKKNSLFDASLMESSFYCLYLMSKVIRNDQKNKHLANANEVDVAILDDDAKVDADKCYECCTEFDEQRFKCSGCMKVYYCSTKCQKSNWKKHKFDCKTWRNRNTNKMNQIMINVLRDKRVMQFLHKQLARAPQNDDSFSSNFIMDPDESKNYEEKILFYGCSLNANMCKYMMKNHMPIIAQLIKKQRNMDATKCLVCILVSTVQDNLQYQKKVIELGVIEHFVECMDVNTYARSELMSDVLELVILLLQNWRDKASKRIRINKLKAILTKQYYGESIYREKMLHKIMEIVTLCQHVSAL
eukprot:64810_1